MSEMTFGDMKEMVGELWAWAEHMRKAAINRGTLNALILMLALTENGRTNASTRKHNVQAVLSPESHSRLGVIGQTGRTHPHQAWMLDQITDILSLTHTRILCVGNVMGQLKVDILMRSEDCL